MERFAYTQSHLHDNRPIAAAVLGRRYSNYSNLLSPVSAQARSSNVQHPAVNTEKTLSTTSQKESKLRGAN